MPNKKEILKNLDKAAKVNRIKDYLIAMAYIGGTSYKDISNGDIAYLIALIAGDRNSDRWKKESKNSESIENIYRDKFLRDVKNVYHEMFGEEYEPNNTE